MDRRAYLTTVGSGLALLAGCSDSDGDAGTYTLRLAEQDAEFTFTVEEN